MPSGAKKRKAAKKKQGKGASIANNPTSTTTSQPHGEEDLKHLESDGGEVSDHHNSEHHLTEGEEEAVEKRKEENRAVVEEGVVQGERETKQDDDFDKKEGSSRSSSSSSGLDDESHVVEKDIPIIDNAPIVDSAAAVDSFSKGRSQLTETVPVSKFESFAEKVLILDEKVVEDSGALAVKSSDLENGESKLSSLEVNGRLALENRKDEETDAAVTSEVKEYGERENEEKLTVSYNPPRDDAAKDAEHMKDSEVLGSSERQPLVASVVQPVQRTSWKGCCGLFELFTGSNA